MASAFAHAKPMNTGTRHSLVEMIIIEPPDSDLANGQVSGNPESLLTS